MIKAKIKELLHKITDYFNSSKLQEKTVTATTNAYGAINLGLDNTEYYVCSVRVSGRPLRAFTMPVGASTYALIMNDSASYSPAASTSVTVIVRYRRAIVGGGYCATSVISRLSGILCYHRKVVA